MKEIRHIFFDLDHTLWDYDRSAQETLKEIYRQFGLSKNGTTEKKFINTFYDINDKLWHQYNFGEIDRSYIQNHRFEKIFEAIGHEANLSAEASEYFMTNCSVKPYLMPDTLTALCYLEKKYHLHIITNGFLDAQGRKLQSSGITKFFKVVVTSECANSRKPAGEIFQYSLEKAGAVRENSVMIGDNPKTDIHGAMEFGMKAIFYDPSGRKRSMADYTIRSHVELLKIF